MDIVVAYTSDTHGVFQKAEYVAGLRKLLDTHKPDLILDGGDATEKCQHLPLLASELSIMTELGYDAMAVGNGEFHEQPWSMERKVGLNSPVLLAANLEINPKMASLLHMISLRLNHSRSHRQPGSDCDLPLLDGAYKYWPIYPYVICKINGFKVGVIGLMPNNTWRLIDRVVRYLTARWRLVSPVSVIQALEETLPKVRERADAVIILSHCSLEENILIEESGLEFNLLLGAHKHKMLPAPPKGATRPFIQSFISPDGRTEDGKPNVAVAIVRLRIGDTPELLDYSVYNALTGHNITPNT